MNGLKARTQWRMILFLCLNFPIFRVCFVFRLFSCLFRVSIQGSRVCIDKHETRNTKHEVFMFPTLLCNFLSTVLIAIQIMLQKHCLKRFFCKQLALQGRLHPITVIIMFGRLIFQFFSKNLHKLSSIDFFRSSVPSGAARIWLKGRANHFQ